MIENLPKEIKIHHLQKFNFGNIEANDDKLLFDSICKTSAINEFLNGSKNIVLGEKGTGKTALFRLIKEDKLKFKPVNGYKNIIIPVEDNFQYKNIKSKLLNLISSVNEEDDFKYQIVWELFFFQKITQRISKLNILLPDTIGKAIDLCNSLLNSSQIDDLVKSKYTFGVKLYDTATSIFPDLYVTKEPTTNESTNKTNSLEKLEIDLDEFKQEINDFLINNELNIIITIDRLDEFVSRNSQDIQLKMLEALIAVEREFGRYSNIELKIFLRDDLFKQLSFEGIGYDKVISKKIDLIWTPEKIREFIAKRIHTNYLSVFGLNNLILSVNQENLEIDTSIDTENYIQPNLLVKIYRKIIKKINPEQYALKFPRKVNLNDNLNKQIILSIFPKYVEFRNDEGKLIEIDIFDYFSENFNLGTGNSIPRLILIFLDKVLSVAKNYYIDNPDQTPIKLSINKCYEVIKKGFFNTAYQEFKTDIQINFSKLNPEFEKTINLFYEKIGNRYSFRAKEIKNLLNIKDDLEIYHFCEYLLHIGYIKRTNTSSSIENMKFEIAHIFRNNK
jgi:DNA polymerase III delta prime subunit